MTEELRTAIKRIREFSLKLNASTDEASHGIRQVELFLNEECSIGIPASIVYRDVSISKETTEFFALVYDRLNGKFQFLVRVEHEIKTQDTHGFAETVLKKIRETAWTQCPRHEKLESFKVLPDLLKEIRDLAAKAIEQTGKSAEALAQVLVAMTDEPAILEPDFDTYPPAFFASFSRAPDSTLDPCQEYLDTETAEMIYVYEGDSVLGKEANCYRSELVASDTSRYVEVPGIGGKDFRHKALQSFIDSDWTEDESDKIRAKDAYEGSIRRWRERVGRYTYLLFLEHESNYATAMARTFWNEAMSKSSQERLLTANE